MEEKPIIEEGARFNWTCNNEVTFVMNINYVDEDGTVHLIVQTGRKSNKPAPWQKRKSITAEDIYQKVEEGFLEPQ